MDDPAALARVRTPELEVAYLDEGTRTGPVVVLLHDFPYDVHAYENVTPLLVGAGRRVIVPYLRGYGPTRFLSATTPRSGQQAALGADLLALLDALGASPRQRSPATTGVAAPPAWSQPCGPSGWRAW